MYNSIREDPFAVFLCSKACCGVEFWLYLLTVVLLVLFAGLMSGLTLGLMSLSLVDLEVISKSGKPKDRENAAKILRVVRKQHLLLCTLLICNALAMEALPIFLDSLMSDWGAILVSVTLILLFGEIIPQSICTRYGLAVGATMAPLVRALVWFFFPIAFPISKILDYVLGDSHVALFRRAELQALVTMHGNEAGKGGELSHQETSIISGALELAGKTALYAMTPISETFSLDIDETLNREKMTMILEKGHSRVPVFLGQPTNIIGLILVKNLLTLDPIKEVLIRNVTIRKIPRVSSDMPLYDILNEFRKGHSHMAVVVSFLEKKEQALEGVSSVSSKINGIPSKEQEVLPKEHVSLHVIDSDSLQDVHDQSITNKTPHCTYENSSNVTLSVKTIRRSKRWSETVSEDILQITNEPLQPFAEDEKVVGIITMEDVIEEILQGEILDETDIHGDIIS